MGHVHFKLIPLRAASPTKYVETEIHGHHVVHFDKSSVMRAAPIDRAEWDRQLAARVETLRVSFPLFQVLTLKELNRRNTIEALAFYHGYTLRPLIELLRIRHAPFHYNFHTRYVHYDLPPDMVKRLEGLFYIATPEALAARRAEAEEWFSETLATLNYK
jgi:hypothetical protein